jgi:hypothetical protein
VDPVRQPVASAFLGPHHPTLRTRRRQGLTIHERRSNPGAHIHAHRSYWEAVLPIPSVMLGAPKPGRGSDEDWWILSWAPESIARRGGIISCVEGWMQTFATRPDQSTWANPTP